jgi:hypothetical protein
LSQTNLLRANELAMTALGSGRADSAASEIVPGKGGESSALIYWQHGGSVADPKQFKLTAPLFGNSRRQRQARGGVFESLRSARDEIAIRIRGIAFGVDPRWRREASCQRRLGASLPPMESLSRELITLAYSSRANPGFSWCSQK